MSAFPLTGGVAANQAFALVWFATNTSTTGSNYGFLTDATFLVPSGAATTEFGAPFVGVNPIRSASDTFGAAIAGSPEPSRLLLLGVGGLAGMMVRRRRVQA